MAQFAFYHHVGSLNRGCEALVRSTSAMLARRGADKIHLFSMHPQEDLDSAYPYVGDISAVSFDESSLQKPLNMADKIRLKLLRQKSAFAADEYYFSKFLNELPLAEDDVFLSIGGDTYCYGDNSNMHAFNLALKKLHKKTILWGCSLDDSSFSTYNGKSLRTFDAIFARDTGSYNLLKANGFTDNIFLHPDPAFTLEPEYLPLPDGFVEGNTIGINASPLVFKYEKNGDGVGLRSYERLMEYILSETDCTIALIPHVFWDASDDRTVLRALFEKFCDSGRVILIEEPYTSSQLKGLIARCRMFIGARTHSTIAAYSTLVPTLVLGYSAKSVNIAEDLFGTREGYVVPIDQLSDENGLANALDALLKKEDEYKAILSQTIPGYVAKAEQAGDTLLSILEK